MLFLLYLIKINHMKKILEIIKYSGWILLLFFLWFKGCEKTEPNKVAVTIPEVKGKFEPSVKIKHDTIYKDKIVKIKDKKLQNELLVLYNENQSLKQNYINSDSLQRELMYLKSIQLNEFYHEFNNDTINITVKGIVQGEVKILQPFYSIKERKQSIAIPEVKFRLLAGFGIKNNINFDNPNISVNFGIQNRKGNILRASYDSEKNINLSYDFSIFAIRR